MEEKEKKRKSQIKKKGQILFCVLMWKPCKDLFLLLTVLWSLTWVGQYYLTGKSLLSTTKQETLVGCRDILLFLKLKV